jgi:hypothetical protein
LAIPLQGTLVDFTAVETRGVPLVVDRAGEIAGLDDIDVLNRCRPNRAEPGTDSPAAAELTSNYQAIEAHGTLAGGGGSARMFSPLEKAEHRVARLATAPRTVLPSGLAQASRMSADVATGHGL